TTVSTQTAYHEYTGDIDVAVESHRRQRLVRLSNGVQVLCVSDGDARQAVAAVCTGTGSSADPDESQGMAHLVEHLLFMGTEKYPGSDFDAFVSSHAGHANAETAGAMTWFYVAVDHEGLGGAVDRLAQFFVAPLLQDVDGEIGVVHAEFEETLGSDIARFQHLARTLSREGGHPYGQFRGGNRTTLRNARVRRFFDAQYSGDAMHVVVFGAAPLDQLTEVAVEAFSAVPTNKGRRRSHAELHPLSAEQLGTVVRFQTAGDVHVLDMEFAVPDMRRHYMRNIEDYVGGLLRADGAGSLAALLRGRGWAAGAVRAYYNEQCTSAGGIFHVGVPCTPEGFDQHAAVVALTFKYIEDVCAGAPLEWFYRELAMADRVRQLRTLASGNATGWVVRIAQRMGNPHLEPAHILTGTLQACYSFDSAEIGRFVALLQPANCRVMLGARSHSGTGPLDSEEPHFGIKYRIDRLDLDLNHAAGAAFCAPAPSEFAAPVAPPSTDSSKGRTHRPQLVCSTEQSELWMAAATGSTVYMYVENGVSGQSPRASACTRLLATLTQTQVDAQLHSARRVGIECAVTACAHGLSVKVSGLAHPLAPVVAALQRIVHIIRSPCSAEAFARALSVRRRYHAGLEQTASPAEMATWFPAYLTKRSSWHHGDCAAELATLAHDEFTAYSAQMLAETRVVMLVAGAQATAEQAQRVLAQSIEALITQPIPAFRQPRDLAHALRPGTYQLHAVHAHSAHNAVCYTVYVGGAGNSRRGRAAAMLLARLASTPFVDQMRTAERLGYAAACTCVAPGKTHGPSALRFVVQGAASPWYMRLRIEAFLRSFRRQTLAALHSDELRLTARRLATTCADAPTAAAYWEHIEARHYDFAQSAAIATHLALLEPADVADLWDTCVAPSSDAARRIVVHVWTPGAYVRRGDDVGLHALPVLALHSCLPTSARLSVDAVAALVRSCADADDAFAQLCKLAEIPGDDAQSVRCALQMAVDAAGEAAPQPPPAAQSLHAAGARRTASNEWVVDDYAAFRNAQPIHGLTVPFTALG
ncbi:metalloprotease, partial [Coemansia sp. IMI 209127]